MCKDHAGIISKEESEAKQRSTLLEQRDLGFVFLSLWVLETPAKLHPMAAAGWPGSRLGSLLSDAARTEWLRCGNLFFTGLLERHG